MVPYYGDFADDDTVNMPFNTFDSNDPSGSVTATDLIASDIFVHKDGSATAITTDGATIDIDAPGVGAHMVTIDTSVDAAYGAGEYAVRINGVTVDGGTVNAWIGAFSIERVGGALARIKLIETAVIANAAGADVAADIIALKAETVLILDDTNATLPTAAECAVAVWDAVQASHVTAGSFGITASEIASILVDTGSIQSETTAILDDTNATLPTAAECAVAVWDAVQASHVNAGSFGITASEIASILVDTGSIQTDTTAILDDTNATLPTAEECATAVWNRDATSNQTTGTFGKAIGDPVADTETIYDAVVKDAAGINVATDIVALNDISTADVNAQVVDVLKTDTVTLPGQTAPPLAPTFEQMISWLYKVLRNRTNQTSTQWSLLADDESTVDAKATVSDDATTAIKQEIVSGP